MGSVGVGPNRLKIPRGTGLGRTPVGEERFVGYHGVAGRPVGNCSAPPGFMDWPIVAVKVEGLWEVRERGAESPVAVFFDTFKPQYYFYSALAAALALKRLARTRGYSECVETIRFS